ncbi:MAG TPA: hypothetical protein P5048_00085 [Chlamydiales bacterium]|nr:hypothetical protein [Chlamydiales bacterium]
MSNTEILDLMSHIDMSDTKNVAALAACMQCDQIKDLSKKRAEIGRVEGKLQQEVVKTAYFMGYLMLGTALVDLGMGMLSSYKIGKNAGNMNALHEEMNHLERAHQKEMGSLLGSNEMRDSYKSDEGFDLEHLRNRPKEHLKRDLEVVSQRPDEGLGGGVDTVEQRAIDQENIKAELKERDTQIATLEKRHEAAKESKSREHGHSSNKVGYWTNGISAFNQGFKAPMDALRNQKDASKSVFSNSYQLGQSTLQSVDGSVGAISQADALSALRIVAQSA